MREVAMVHAVVWSIVLRNNKIIIIASQEDEMNNKYNDKLCTSNEVTQWNEWGDFKCLQKPTIIDWWRLIPRHCVH